MQGLDGVHHLAFSTRDIKSQIAFFNEVLGLELVALFPMHGVPDGWHGFMKLDDRCYLAFVQLPAVAEIAAEIGVTHSGHGANPSAGGTLQHLAFNVADEDELIAMRDRIRSRGVNVFGPIDHGMCKSIYFAGPENLTLEIATSGAALDPRSWIDPDIVEKAGIGPEELARYRSPERFESRNGAVAQPPIDPARPHLAYPERVYRRMVETADDELSAAASYAEPPVRVPAAED
jgi:catechol 2,3-dioxygenase-like lactoylglutathione lyase family enzyme